MRTRSWLPGRALERERSSASHRRSVGDVGRRRVGGRDESTRGNELAIETLKQANLVIDLVFLLHSSEQVEIQRAGARMLLVMVPSIGPAVPEGRRSGGGSRRARSCSRAPGRSG